jgi:hypothetical protein
VLGGIALTVDSGSQENHAAAQQLERFLKRHHSAITHDVVLAGGPVLESLARELGLDEAEAKRFFVALEGSPEQTAMLESLSGGVDRASAELFASRLCLVVERALGAERLKIAAIFATKRRA